MNVLILGAGGVGAVAARAAHRDHGAEVTICDRDLAAAEAVADDCDGTALQVDIADPSSLSEVLTPHVDLVINTVGPFFRYGPLALARAIAAGCHYVDVCDDPEPLEQMFGLDLAAKAAGVTAVIGLGASPGISNLLARAAGDALDEVESVVTAWNAVDDFRDAQRRRIHNAATVHWMQQLSGTIQAVRGGGVAEVSPLEHIPLRLPGGCVIATHSVGHPEPITLARRYPGMKHSSNVMTGDIRLMRLLGELTAEIDGGRLNCDAAAAAFYMRIPSLEPLRTAQDCNGGELPGVFAIARGSLGGRRVTAYATTAFIPGGGTAEATGVPLALAVPLIGAGHLAAGVYGPEEVIAPADFFALLAGSGVTSAGESYRVEIYSTPITYTS